MDVLHLTIQPHLIAVQISNAAVNQKLCSFAPICGKLSLSVFPCNKSDFWRGQLEYLELNFILFSLLLLPPMICRDMMLAFYLFFLIEYLLHCNEKRNLLFFYKFNFLTAWESWFGELHLCSEDFPRKTTPEGLLSIVSQGFYHQRWSVITHWRG